MYRHLYTHRHTYVSRNTCTYEHVCTCMYTCVYRDVHVHTYIKKNLEVGKFLAYARTDHVLNS